MSDLQGNGDPHGIQAFPSRATTAWDRCLRKAEGYSNPHPTLG